MNQHQILQICDTFKLGKPQSEATCVLGGLKQRMWRIDTSLGTFAIKELDPMVMISQATQAQYIMSEKFVLALQNKNFPVVPALFYHDSPLHNIEGAIVMIYPWVNGKTISFDFTQH